MHHEVRPSGYHNTLGPHDPILWVHSGDRITTDTVDARGFDHLRDQVAIRGNPMTGPFAVQEAEPGDALAVRILEITPSRTYGFTTASTAPHCVEPAFAASLPPNDLVEWRIDLAARQVHLVAPRPASCPELVLPLDPMLGCFGVAPARNQAISTATSGPYGGNMDYRACRAGAAIAFPVSTPGGLFYLGDVHAVQGDGEISGNGVEVSARVTFELHLLKQYELQWPRLIDSVGIATIGNARPLDQATQICTTEMLRWLPQEFGLEPAAAHLWLQQTVRYEVGNIFDPAYTMACRLPREFLPTSGPQPLLNLVRPWL
jgi:acetamidase/formamidase